jgi:hypothetical protein
MSAQESVEDHTKALEDLHAQLSAQCERLTAEIKKLQSAV